MKRGSWTSTSFSTSDTTLHTSRMVLGDGRFARLASFVVIFIELVNQLCLRCNHIGAQIRTVDRSFAVRRWIQCLPVKPEAQLPAKRKKSEVMKFAPTADRRQVGPGNGWMQRSATFPTRLEKGLSCSPSQYQLQDRSPRVISSLSLVFARENCAPVCSCPDSAVSVGIV